MRSRVLLVEDDGAVRSDLAGALERHGFDVVTASRGDQAIELLRRRRPDAIVVDLLLPGGSGFEVMGAARDLAPARNGGHTGGDIVVLAISGTFIGPRNRQDAIGRFDLLDLLVKPVDAVGLAERLLSRLDASAGPERRRRAPAAPVEPAPAPPIPAARPPEPSSPPAVATRVPFPEDVPEAGDLADTLFAHLLVALSARAATGILKLLHGRKRKDVFLRAGTPVHVRGNIVAECLGRILVREGVISDAEARRSVRLLKERDARQGDILVEMGAVDEEGLAWGLSRQLTEKLLEIFTWTAGTFRFVPTNEPPPAAAVLPDGVPAVVSEGIRRRMPWARVERELAAWDEAYPVWGSSPSARELDLGFGPAEEEFFVHLDGQRRTARVLAESELPPEAAARALLAMLLTRRVDLAAERDARRTARVPPPDRHGGGHDAIGGR